MESLPLFFRAAACALMIVCAAAAKAEITGSAHDFSNQAWSNQEMCGVCHTPHDANKSVVAAPLWNHQVTTATYTLYSSPWVDVAPVQPRGPSKLCLSCHDGTVALDSFGGNAGTNFIDPERSLGTDLSDDHPVSVQWNHQIDFDERATMCYNCHRRAPGGGWEVPKLPLIDEYVECVTCHEPHNSVPDGNPSLLRLSTAYGELCLFCHNK